MKKHLINSLKFVWNNMAKIFYMLLGLLWIIFPDDFYKIHTNDMNIIKSYLKNMNI